MKYNESQQTQIKSKIIQGVDNGYNYEHNINEPGFRMGRGGKADDDDLGSGPRVIFCFPANTLPDTL